MKTDIWNQPTNAFFSVTLYVKSNENGNLFDDHVEKDKKKIYKKIFEFFLSCFNAVENVKIKPCYF